LSSMVDGQKLNKHGVIFSSNVLICLIMVNLA
jgi:hypothetical protein